MSDPMDEVFINFNKNYRRITQERKPVVKQPKLKNVTPKKVEFKQLEFNFEEVNNGS
jgi:hypothetical protein|tara:strand:+ start:887 stop:1057 length:171 start_codon:yes stop_codon:yes gene_type:complete